MGPIEKPPLQSKKFVAFLISEITWKAVLIILLVTGIREAKIDVFLGGITLAIIIIAGATEALYIGGQKALDQYTRIAQIAVSGGQGFQMGNITTHKQLDVPTEMPNPEDG